ncbi:MAG: hypothetical protein FWG87_04645 [Defluviitaleaceae bacterium]|nr:hypothetical protein [Defluviitaleaceae bacterium]
MTIRGYSSNFKRGKGIAFKTADAPAKSFTAEFKKFQESQTESLLQRLIAAREKIREEQRKQRPAKKKTGVTRLSNTDSLRKAHQVRAQLVAKLGEVYTSNLDERTRDIGTMDIKLQINKVDQQIMAIRRRERAIEEEKTTRRSDDTPSKRRRRFYDMEEKRVYIRRDYLFHADDGGYDPNINMEVVV